MWKQLSFISIGILAIGSLSFSPIEEKKESKNTFQDKSLNKAAIHFKTYCSGCHGEKMEAFADRKWKYGNSRENIFKSIKNGYEEGGMPSFKTAFKDGEIYALADYILKGIAGMDKYSGSDKPKSNIFQTEKLKIRLDTIYAGGNIPWSISFLPNGDILSTDRGGTLTRISKNKTNTKISGTPEVLAKGQGGLMEVLVHPDFEKNQTIYLSYSKPKQENGKTLVTTAVMKAKLVGNNLSEQKDIFIAEPYLTTQHHYGGKLAFGKDGYLYISVGERGREKENPQNLKRNSLGKIHRIKDDGSIVESNPFTRQTETPGSIYSYGHRNPQGLAFHPKTGALWSNEHGPRGGDELNIVQPGKNYGWPVISYGINYNGTPITNITHKEGMEQPQHYWIPSIATSGLTFVNSPIYKGWEDNALIGSLRFEYLNRCELKNNKVVHEEILFKNIGRLRDVRQGPDGYIYIAVENPGRIFKLVPVN
ncbi:glucose sorbosone dehydrogenase [Pseudopedobacter saltans DSM 12145]|uniref:Glucose sorbosone dehydrogenase n=1 Tax=Pseudopedobacter saltans (strain ATCC 51119 / DSM 12145 / JCM 21818 / CCUG 39354 / LMG 10337 / NBRC 100064 / NCIMB 13643) TaxID=762903 RepID=F0S7N0_PSESL|nr:PQQ-dependent sugar dehydrogenase [Pseudopedobacter saltans]ADY52290.1 glucose sorbosone dehydrogenase [Pseudopedobacter saltans DSM 12145]